MSAKNSIQVAIKVRPLLRKEKNSPICWRVRENTIQLEGGAGEPYYFDHIFDHDANNELIFDKMAKHIVHAAIEGFNGTIFAYGQTSSGKTYTMIGDEYNPGVMVLAAKEIFKEIERSTDRQFLLRVGYIEIYNEKIYDLLKKQNTDLKIHETASGNVSVACEEVVITSEDDLLRHLCLGNKERTTGETQMNERSSRSHAIFRIIIESRKVERTEDDAIIQSVLNLVDLAGSERADQTGATGARLKEGGHINKSLLFLSTVIKRLSENEDDSFISFRDSKLTRILQASLGGNALTSVICTIKPNAVDETQSTLSFALRAKNVKNKPQVNEIVSESTMMKRLEREIKSLKARLEEERSKNEERSQIKVGQLEKHLKNEVLKFITSNSVYNVRKQNHNRRRTWAPDTDNSEHNLTFKSSALAQPLPTPQILSRIPAHKNSLITMRTSSAESHLIRSDTYVKEELLEKSEDEFVPGEICNFSTSPTITEEQRTPSSMRTLSLTPIRKGHNNDNLEAIANAMNELEEFVDLEKQISVEHETLEMDLHNTQTQLLDFKRSSTALHAHINTLEESNAIANEKIRNYEVQMTNLQETNKKLQEENRSLVGLDVEFERLRNKSKLRENELLELLEEKNIKLEQLQKSLDSNIQKHLTNNREDLEQENEVLQLEIQELKQRLEAVQCQLLENAQDESLQRNVESIQERFDEMQQKYNELSNEYDDLSSQLMDSVQEGEALRTSCQQLEKELDSVRAKCELLTSAKNNVEEENNVLRAQLEDAHEKSTMSKYENNVKNKIHLSMDSDGDTNSILSHMSSGIGSSSDIECVQTQISSHDGNMELYEKFTQLLATVELLELELHNNSRRLKFKLQHDDHINNDMPCERRKMLLFCDRDVSKVKPNDLKFASSDNICLQGSFKGLIFSIMDLNVQLEEGSFVVELKEQLATLKADNDKLRVQNHMLIEENERAISDMREQITKLSSELSEKTICVEALEREYAEMSLVYEELQTKIKPRSSISPNNDVLNESEEHNPNETLRDETIPNVEEAIEDKSLCDLNELKTERKKNQELIAELQTNLETTRNNLLEMEIKCQELELEMLQKLEESADGYRENLRKCQLEWQQEREVCMQKCQDLEEKLHESLNALAEQKETKENQKLEQQFKAYDNLVDMLDQFKLEKESLEQEFYEVKADNEMLLDAKNLAITEKELLQHKLEKLEKEVTEKELQITELKSKLDWMSAEKLNNIKEIENLNASIAKYQGDIENAMKVQEEVGSKINAKIDLLAACEEKLITSENMKDELIKTNIRLNSEKDKIIEDFNNNMLELIELRKKLQQVELEKEAQKEELEAQLNKLQQDLGEKEDNDIKLKEMVELKQKVDELLGEKLTFVAYREQIVQEKQAVDDKYWKLFYEHEECASKLIKYAQLENECIVLRENKCELEIKSSELHKKYQELKDKQMQGKQENDNLREEKERIHKEKQEIDNEYFKLCDEHAKCVLKLDKLETQCNELERKFEPLVEKLNTLQHKYEEVHSDYNQLQTEKSILIAEKEHVLRKKKEIDDKYKKLHEEHNTCVVKSLESEPLEKERNNLINKCQQLEWKLKEVQNNCNQLKIEKSNIEDENKKIIQEKNSIDEKYNQLSENHRINVLKLEQLETECSELMKTSEKIDTGLITLQDKYVVLQADYHRLQTVQSTLENEKRGLQKEKQEIAEHRDELAEKNEKLLGEHKNYDSLMNERNELKIKLQQLESKFDELQTKYVLTQSEQQQLQAQIPQYEEQKIELVRRSEQLESSIVEQKLKYTQLQEAHAALKLKYDNLQKEVTTVHADMANLLKTHKLEVELNKNRLIEDSEIKEQQLKLQETKYGELRTQLKKARDEFSAEREKLKTAITGLLQEKTLLNERLLDMEDALKKMGNDSGTNIMMSLDVSVPANLSPTSHQKRKSGGNCETNNKLKASMERKNRRLSTHDDNRKMFCDATRDVGSMTDPHVCNCYELEMQLAESEKKRFISQSQVHAREMALRNHPLKEENAKLMKRLKEEIDRHSAEVRSLKKIIIEKTTTACQNGQSVAAATTDWVPKISSETQTESHLESEFTKLQSKFSELKDICRQRLKTIQSLEKNIAQKENMSNGSGGNVLAPESSLIELQNKNLKEELNVIQGKYGDAKKLLNLRRVEIENLKKELTTLKLPLAT